MRRERVLDVTSGPIFGKLLLFALPLIACLFLIPCLLLWRFGVRHYRSTGS